MTDAHASVRSVIIEKATRIFGEQELCHTDNPHGVPEIMGSPVALRLAAREYVGGDPNKAYLFILEFGGHKPLIELAKQLTEGNALETSAKDTPQQAFYLIQELGGNERLVALANALADEPSADLSDELTRKIPGYEKIVAERLRKHL